MKILVTGAAGFIGSHLCRELEEHGHDVVRVDVVLHGWQDVTRYNIIREVIKLARPDIVVHLAAKVGRQFGEDDPAETIRENAIGTANVARAAAEWGARLAYASTSEVYGDRHYRTAYEDELYSFAYVSGGSKVGLPHNVYGLSKRWGEEACRLYAPEGLVIWRLSMPYGPGLPAGRGRAAICNFLDQADRRVEIPVHRGAERSWCWIGDTVRALRMTLEQPHGSAFNVGRDDDSRPMLEVARIACDLTGAPYSLIREIPAPPRQTVVKRLSTGKIRHLGWQPEVALEEGMARLLEWLRSTRKAAA